MIQLQELEIQKWAADIVWMDRREVWISYVDFDIANSRLDCIDKYLMSICLCIANQAVLSSTVWLKSLQILLWKIFIDFDTPSWKSKTQQTRM